MTRRAAAICLAGAMRGFGQTAPPRLIQSIPLPNVEGRLGHPGIDAAGQRLFIPATTAGVVLVVHVSSGKVLATIPNVKGPQAAFYVSEPGRIYVSSRDEGAVRVFDGRTLQALPTVKDVFNADRLHYHVPTKSVLVTHATGAAAMDLNGKRKGDIRIDSQPEGMEVDPSGTRMFLADSVRKSIVVAEIGRSSITRIWPVDTIATMYGLAYDADNKRLFVTCRRPNRMLILDGFSGLKVDERDTVADPAAVFYHPPSKRILVVGSGEIDVVKQSAADHYEPVARIPTRRLARTAVYIAETGRLVVAAPRIDSQSAALLVYDVSR